MRLLKKCDKSPKRPLQAPTFKQQVKCAFDRADDYDRHANVQRQVASKLAEQIGKLPLANNARILEIGAGTGFLGEALLGQFPEADWLMTDIAPAMLDRCRARFVGQRNIRFAQLDGETPGALGQGQQFDLICSSLAAQWFTDLPHALDRLLGFVKPGGFLLISTLAQGTFREWISAHLDCGYAAGTPVYPDIASLRKMRFSSATGHVDEHIFVDHPADGVTFLRSLRAIGAATALSGHRPLRAPELHRVIRQFEATGSRVSYNVAFCLFTHRPRRFQDADEIELSSSRPDTVTRLRESHISKSNVAGYQDLLSGI